MKTYRQIPYSLNCKQRLQQFQGRGVVCLRNFFSSDIDADGADDDDGDDNVDGKGLQDKCEKHRNKS